MGFNPWDTNQNGTGVGTGTMPADIVQQTLGARGQNGAPTNGVSQQQFGLTPAQIGRGGLLGPTSAGQVANSLNGIMGRQAPQIAGADFSGMQNTQASQLGLMNQLRGYAQGLGPSAAQIGGAMSLGQAAQANRGALAGGNPLAARAALGGMGAGMNSAAMNAAQNRSAETGNIFGALGKQGAGLSNNALGASSLADLQIQQQQALGLGQAQRNYQLGQGILGTGLQGQMDQLRFAQNMLALNQKKSNDITNNEIKLSAAAAQSGGSAFTSGAGG